MRVAEAVIDTYKAANSALATYPFPFGGIAAGALVAVGLANVKKITAQKFEGGSPPPSTGGGGGGGGGGLGGGGGSQGGTPTFNPIDIIPWQ